MAWFPPAEGRFTSSYGARVAPTTGASTYHRGVDIAPPIPGQTGRPVVSIGDGLVVGSGYSSVRGWWVVIKHRDGSFTRSQHLAERGAAWGTRVDAGQRIGTIGKTGRSVGEHLHFETFNPGADWTSSYNAVDPEPFMRDRGVELRTAILVTNPLWDGAGLPLLPTIPAAPVLPDQILESDMRDAIDAQYRTSTGRTPSDKEADPRVLRVARGQSTLKSELDAIAGSGEAKLFVVNPIYRELLGRSAKLSEAVDWYDRTGGDAALIRSGVAASREAIAYAAKKA